MKKPKIRYPGPLVKRRRRKNEPEAADIATKRIMALADDLMTEFVYDTQTERGKVTYAASRMGIDPTILYAMRCGCYGRFGLKLIERIARATGCTLGALMDPE